MSLSVGAVQTAFITRYRGDGTLQSLLGTPTNPPGAIFDASGVPTGQPMPYLVVVPITAQSGTARAMGQDGLDIFMQVAILTQSSGFNVARQLAAQVYALTQQYSFALSGGPANCFTLFEQEHEMPQNDGLTQLLTHRYKVMTIG